MARSRYRGHYCWACGRIRANEKFSGRNHARHLCKECARLGKDELEYRQAVCDMDRLLRGGQRIPRKRREQFRKFLAHENERVRRTAEEIELAGALDRAETRMYCDLDEVFLELMGEGVFVLADPDGEPEGEEDTEIPEDWPWLAEPPFAWDE